MRFVYRSQAMSQAAELQRSGRRNDTLNEAAAGVALSVRGYGDIGAVRAQRAYGMEQRSGESGGAMCGPRRGEGTKRAGNWRFGRTGTWAPGHGVDRKEKDRKTAHAASGGARDRAKAGA